MPDYNSLRQLMGVGFLPQPSAPPYPDFAQQGTSSGGTMQPMPPSGGYGAPHAFAKIRSWGWVPDVLDANQLAGVGAGWNPQPDVMQPWGPGANLGGGWVPGKPDVLGGTDWKPGEPLYKSLPEGFKSLIRPGMWNTQMPAQQPQQAIYDPYRPWGRR